MSQFNKVEAEHQRRVILNMLETNADYAQNEAVLKTALRFVGHNVSSDKLNNELHWLQEQGLVDLTQVSGLTIARMTQRGIDVASGASSVTGIARKEL